MAAPVLRNVDVGNLVSAGQDASLLIRSGNLDPIYTDFTVAEPDLPLVRQYLNGPNLKVLTDAEDDNFAPREGSLYFIDNAVQPGAGTVQAARESRRIRITRFGLRNSCKCA